MAVPRQIRGVQVVELARATMFPIRANRRISRLTVEGRESSLFMMQFGRLLGQHGRLGRLAGPARIPPRWRTHLGSHGYCKPASPTSFDIVRRAHELNVRLSPREIECLLTHCDEMGNRDGKLTHDEFMNLAKKERDDDAERQVLVGFIVKSDEHTVGQRVLQAIDYLSTALFGAVGVIIAGQTGMNVVGTTFVGCIACLGGGTLNDMMTGNTRQGIFWMRNPAFLGIALGTSVVTFYAWPMFEESYAQRQMATLRQAAGVAPGEQIGSEAFVAALAKEPKEARVIFSAVDRHIEEELGRACLDDAERARLVFDWLLKAHPSPSRELETPALQLVARLCVLDSPNVYILETLGLGGLAVIGAQAGIVRGVHPLACIATGVTICFGGVLRDLLCHRPLAIGAQSYALATAAGASVYVGLRQLVIAGYPIPLPLRIVLGACTAMAQRVYSYYSHGVHDQFLKPMANYRASTRLIPSGKSSEDLCDAAARGDCATVKRLVVERGLDPCKGDYDARTPLHLAASEGMFEVVRFLVDECAVDVNPIDRWGGTPLDDATRSKHALIAAFLVSRGGKPSARR